MNRIKASFTHFLVSVSVVGLALAVVLFLWYPTPYNETNDIWSMIRILICVDLVLGPLITLIIFNTKKKSRSELKRDLGVIATVQMVALCYGMYSMFVQRPNYLVFGVDRFEVMAKDRVDDSPLPESLGHKPLVGPLVVFAHSGSSAEEKQKLMRDWMGGKGDFTTRRDYYRPVSNYINEIKRRAVNVNDVFSHPANLAKTDEIASLKSYASDNTNDKVFLPLIGKSRSMIVAFDTNTAKVGPVFKVFPFSDIKSEPVVKGPETGATETIAVETSDQ